jgi:putative MATE family efflux protein
MKDTQASPTAPAHSAPLFSGRALFSIIFPLILQQILSITIGTADSMMVARAGEAAVSGVSLVNTLDTLLVLVFTSLVSGGSVVVSQALGRKDFTGARTAAKQLLYASTGIALLVSVTVILCRHPLLNLLFGAVEADVMQSALGYFFFVALSFPFLAIESANAASFRAMGNSMISLLVSLMMNLINIGGNALFILVFEWGAIGAAVATLISRIVGATVLTILLHSKKNAVYLEKLLHYKPDFRVIRSILHIGVPNGIENGMFQFGKLLTQTLISTMPTAAIAANAVANTLANIQYMTGAAFSNTMVTVVGRCIGAEEKEQAKRYARLLTVLEYLALFIMALVTVIFAKPLIAVYDLSPDSSALAYRLILYHSICAVLVWPIAFTLPSAFRASSDVRFPLVVSMFSMWTFRVALSYVFAQETVSLFGLITFPGLGMGVMGVWVAMTVDWLFRMVMFIWRFVSGKWLTVKRV